MGVACTKGYKGTSKLPRCNKLPHLSALRARLQDLLKKENEFIWAQNHQLCFDQIKEAVCKDITLKFYDPNLPIFIQTDASQNGIGVVLL